MIRKTGIFQAPAALVPSEIVTVSKLLRRRMAKLNLQAGSKHLDVRSQFVDECLFKFTGFLAE